jgi:hypothetical protein
MRNNLIAGAAAAALALTAVSAHATEFKGTDTVTPATQAPGSGLVVNVAPINPTFDFTLAPNNPHTKKNEAQTTLKLFTIYTNETTLNGDDLSPQKISLTFDFTLPTLNDGLAPITGTTDGQFQLFGILQDGVLTWDDSTVDLYYGPAALPQADKGDLQITLNGGTFNQGVFGLDGGKRDGLTVSATFDWKQDPILSALPAAVPEPASWALMIGGFGLSGAMLRRRRSVAAAA